MGLTREKEVRQCGSGICTERVLSHVLMHCIQLLCLHSIAYKSHSYTTIGTVLGDCYHTSLLQHDSCFGFSLDTELQLPGTGQPVCSFSKQGFSHDRATALQHAQKTCSQRRKAISSIRFKHYSAPFVMVSRATKLSEYPSLVPDG